MAQQPQDQEKAPDPARSYERAKPEKESGMGRLDNNKATPTDREDKPGDAVRNSHPPRQINAHDVVNQAGGPAPVQPDHSMKDEEPLGWDQAPTDIKNPRDKRHPRTEGKGGVK